MLTAGLSLAYAPSALASHQFTDVPDGAPFHLEIAIFKGTNITTGCTATTFCPQEPVKRQAMAAFIDRALGLVVRPGETTQTGVPGSRVAVLDDDQSFVGTSGNVLAYRGPGDNVVGGHSANSVTAGVVAATIAGGGDAALPNSVNAHYATVSGGFDNTASGFSSVVAGGYRNTASGIDATAAGGSYNLATQAGSFAAGRKASAIHVGSFVWSDGNWQGADTIVRSPGDFSFSAHATGGFNFWTNATGATTGCWIFAGGGSINCSSDRNAKENVRAVDPQVVLERVAKLPITTWNYKSQKDRFRHIGPMAQDFAKAFGVGEDDTSIAMVDADGISLVAIQALYRQKNAEVTALKRQNAAQSDRIAALERSVATLIRKEDR